MSWLARQRSLIAALPLVGFGLWTLELFSGRPNLMWMAALFTWALVASAFAWWLLGNQGERLLARVDRHATGIAVGLIAGYALLLVAITVAQTWLFAPGVFAYDTAYYGQLLWNTVHGDILAANLQQEQLYDPPVSSDLAIHVSPVLLAFLPIYALFPDTLTLLVLRDLALAAAAWPLFLIARERLGGAAGVAAVLLYFANPVVSAQAVSAFYLLHFAPLPLLFALRAFLNKTFAPFAIWTCIALSLREDIAVTLGAFGLLILLRRYPFRWSVMGLVVPIVWWGLSTLLIQPAFGRAGNARFDDVLTGGSDSPLGMYEVLLGNPSWLLDVLAQNGPEYFLRLIGWGAYLAVLVPEVVIAAPGLLMQLFLGQVSYVGLDPYSRFAFVPACALLAATVIAVARVARKIGVEKGAWAMIVLLLLPSVTLLDGSKDLAQRTAEITVLSNDRAALRAVLGEIPDDASIAAPNYLLPYLANRNKLYYLEKMADYSNASPDYVFLDQDVGRLWLNAEQVESYRVLSATLLSSGRYSMVWERGDYSLLRRNAT